MSRKKTTKKATKRGGGRTPKVAKGPKTSRPSKSNMSDSARKTRKTGAPTAHKPMSGLDAAAKVLADGGKPMRARELVDAMIKGGLWKCGGRTPHSTIYAAMIREIAAKGDAARFKKVDRGLFTFNG